MTTSEKQPVLFHTMKPVHRKLYEAAAALRTSTGVSVDKQ